MSDWKRLEMTQLRKAAMAILLLGGDLVYASYVLSGLYAEGVNYNPLRGSPFKVRLMLR